MTTDELQDLADRFAAIEAPTLAAAVHRRDPHTIAAILNNLTRQELYALTVAIAADVVIDDITVERVAIHGDRERLTVPERAAGVAALLERGHSNTEISRRLRLNGSTVRRLVSAVRAAAPS